MFFIVVDIPSICDRSVCKIVVMVSPVTEAAVGEFVCLLSISSAVDVPVSFISDVERSESVRSCPSAVVDSVVKTVLAVALPCVSLNNVVSV